MSVSQRMRFEVLKRDNFKCRYCGKTAEAVELEVDHVTPTALGGTDDADNLVTACGPCNDGKGSTAPDAVLTAALTVTAPLVTTAFQRTVWWLLGEFTAAELTAPLSGGPDSTDLGNAFGLWFSGWTNEHPPFRADPAEAEREAVKESIAAAAQVGYPAPFLWAASGQAGRAQETDIAPYAAALQEAVTAELKRARTQLTP